MPSPDNRDSPPPESAAQQAKRLGECDGVDEALDNENQPRGFRAGETSPLDSPLAELQARSGLIGRTPPPAPGTAEVGGAPPSGREPVRGGHRLGTELSIMGGMKRDRSESA